MSTQKEAATALTAANDKLDKVGTEITALKQEVADLKATAQNADQMSPELQTAIDAVVTRAQGLDDLNADAPALTPTDTTPAP